MTDEEAEMLGYGAVFAAEDEETPLYTHAQLVEERRRAWNEAIEAAATVVASQISADTNMRDYITTYFATRALTKDSTHD